MFEQGERFLADYGEKIAAAQRTALDTQIKDLKAAIAKKDVRAEPEWSPPRSAIITTSWVFRVFRRSERRKPCNGFERHSTPHDGAAGEQQVYDSITESSPQAPQITW